jgi:nitrite reductase/ring-hydroxylating ferredoxin subunit
MTWTPTGLHSVDGTELTQVTVAGQPLVLLRLEDGWTAAEDRCAHAGCPFSTDGRLEDGRLVCDCHGSEFEPRTGAVLRGPAVRPVTVYAVREGPDGGLEVDL